MKMRKIVCSFMISVVCFMTAISGVSATSYDTSKINAAYSKVVEYYKNNNNLNNADKILAVESLGLEAESNQFDISSVDFSKTSLSKKIVTEVLLGVDPTEDKKTLGTYKNGSVFEKAKKAYDKMMNPEQPDNTKPAQPTDTKKDSQSTNKVETTNQKTTSVKTGDETNVVIFVSLSMVSGGLFLVLRKEYERVH